MDQSTNEIIALLRQAVEAKMGFTLRSPYDFEQLVAALELEHQRNDSANRITPLSISTIKRIWQYVPSNHTPRIGTLSILSRFVGCRDWDDFVKTHAGQSEPVESGFTPERVNTISQIAIGEQLEMEWLPNRMCRVQKISADRFRVVAVKNCKLSVGDEFYAAWFSIGYPLFVSHLRRGDTDLPNYIAGKKHGLSSLRIVRDVHSVLPQV